VLCDWEYRYGDSIVANFGEKTSVRFCFGWPTRNHHSWCRAENMESLEMAFSEFYIPIHTSFGSFYLDIQNHIVNLWAHREVLVKSVMLTVDLWESATTVCDSIGSLYYQCGKFVLCAQDIGRAILMLSIYLLLNFRNLGRVISKLSSQAVLHVIAFSSAEAYMKLPVNHSPHDHFYFRNFM
jgi:hypothetical protein